MLKVLLIGLLGYISVVQGQTLPGDAAGYEGDSLNLTCSSSSANNAVWTHEAYGSPTSRYIVIPNGQPESGYSLMEDNLFNLQIHSVSQASAGKYGCSLVQGGSPGDENNAYVMMLDNFACDEESTGEETNREVRFVCSIRVYGQVNPSMEWTREGVLLNAGEPTVYDGDLQNAWDWRTVRLYYNTTAQAEFDNTEHKCRVFFGESSNSGVRPASFETSCTDIYRSRHAPNNVQIMYNGMYVIAPEQITVTEGDYLNCSVSSYPEAIITWERVQGPGTTIPTYMDVGENESQMFIDETMLNGQNVYQCVATQGMAQAEAQVHFIVERRTGGGASGLALSFAVLTLTILSALINFY